MKKPLFDQFERMVMRERPDTLWSQRMRLTIAKAHIDRAINKIMKPTSQLYVLLMIMMAFLVATIYLCQYFNSMWPLLLMLICPNQIKQSTK